MRKPPILHTVKRHRRRGQWVESYERGKGTRPVRVRKHVVVGQPGIKPPGWLLDETEYILQGIEGLDIKLLRMVDGVGVFTGTTSPELVGRRAELDYVMGRVIDENFTHDELGRLGCIGVFSVDDLREAFGDSVAGMFHDNLPDGIMVTMDPNNVNPSTAIHEIIHGLRVIRDEEPRDIDIDEKETELETLVRLTNIYGDADWHVGAGYYEHIPVVKEAYSKDDDITAQDEIWKAVEHDRKLVTGSIENHLIGEPAVTGTIEKYPDSIISTAVFSPAERLDRYFVIQRPGKREIDVHLDFDKPPDESKVIGGLTKLYGADAKIWEWKDGIKVRVQ